MAAGGLRREAICILMYSVRWWLWSNIQILQFYYSFVLFWLISWVFRMTFFGIGFILYSFKLSGGLCFLSRLCELWSTLFHNIATLVAKGGVTRCNLSRSVGFPTSIWPALWKLLFAASWYCTFIHDKKY